MIRAKTLMEINYFKTIDNEIYRIYETTYGYYFLGNLYKTETITEKFMIEQDNIRIIEVIDNMAIARYCLTNEDFAVVNVNGKWLIGE